MLEFHYREELRNVIENYPLFPGNTVSHEGARICKERGWIVRNSEGYWIPTAKGLRADIMPPYPSEETKSAPEGYWSFIEALREGLGGEKGVRKFIKDLQEDSE